MTVEGWEGVLPDNDSGGLGRVCLMMTTVERWEGALPNDNIGGWVGGIT